MAPVSTLSFRCALITGGGGGLGRAMAERLISMGKEVIIVGRTEESLKKAAKEIGAKTYYVLDVSNISTMAAFVHKITTNHPELDCVINNAGVKRPFQILGPDYNFDLDKADQEIDTNIRGPLHLSVLLVPHLNKQPNGAVIMNMSSVLGYNPISLVNPVYNGTKAWVPRQCCAVPTCTIRCSMHRLDRKSLVVTCAVHASVTRYGARGKLPETEEDSLLVL